MAYCRKCGKEIDDEAVICPHCGVPQNNYYPNYGRTNPTPTVTDDGNAGWAVLSFLLPIVGIILYLFMKDSKPNNAAACKKGLIIGFIVWIIAIFMLFGDSILWSLMF